MLYSLGLRTDAGQCGYTMSAQAKTAIINGAFTGAPRLLLISNIKPFPARLKVTSVRMAGFRRRIEPDDREGYRLVVSESYLHLTLGDLYGRDKCTLVGDVAGCDGATAQNRLSRFDHSHQVDLSTGS